MYQHRKILKFMLIGIITNTAFVLTIHSVFILLRRKKFYDITGKYIFQYQEKSSNLSDCHISIAKLHGAEVYP